MDKDTLENIKDLYRVFQQKIGFIKKRLLGIKKDTVNRKEETKINEIRNKLDQL